MLVSLLRAIIQPIREVAMDTKKPEKAPKSGSASFASSSRFSDELPRPLDEMLQPGPELSGDSSAASPPSLSRDARATAKSLGRAVKEQVGEFTSEIGHELSKTAEHQKTRGIEAMQAFARAVDTAAEELEQHSPLAAQYARDAAHRVEGLSANIRGRNINELMDSATELARSRPGLFFAGAVAAGFALSRFMKSSASHHVPESADYSPPLMEPGP
jgi:hypothetical protein